MLIPPSHRDRLLNRESAPAPDNGLVLRSLIESSGLTQAKALAVFNHGQARPLSARTLKSYLAAPGSASRLPCPDRVVAQMRNALATFEQAILHNDSRPSGCPFGCSDGSPKVRQIESRQFATHCDGCGARGPVADNEREALRLWNQR